jgi:ATP-dependent DNA ligase
MPVETLVMLHERLRPLAIKRMPLAKSPPRKQRFGGPLALSKVHWIRPELVAGISYLSWSDDGLLRHTVFLGLREDSPRGKFGEKRRARNDHRAGYTRRRIAIAIGESSPATHRSKRITAS